MGISKFIFSLEKLTRIWTNGLWISISAEKNMARFLCYVKQTFQLLPIIQSNLEPMYDKWRTNSTYKWAFSIDHQISIRLSIEKWNSLEWKSQHSNSFLKPQHIFPNKTHHFDSVFQPTWPISIQFNAWCVRVVHTRTFAQSIWSIVVYVAFMHAAPFEAGGNN